MKCHHGKLLLPHPPADGMQIDREGESCGMAVVIREVYDALKDVVRLLEEHPEWREERQRLLDDIARLTGRD